MPSSISIIIQEGIDELKALHTKSAPAMKPRLKMLISLSKGITVVSELAARTGVSAATICAWKNKYRNGGLQALISEGRGGDKRSGITSDQKQKIAGKLSDPKAGLLSYGQAQAWLREELGIEKEYHALNKYLKRNWGTKLKVGRKSHVKKDEAAVAVFKKPARGR